MNTEKKLYGMYHTKIDQEGKIELPAKARAFLSDKKVVLIGHGDHLELWDQTELEQKAQNAELLSDNS